MKTHPLAFGLTMLALIGACRADATPVPAPAPPTAQPTPTPQRVVVAYLAGYSLGAIKPELVADLTDLVYFAIEPRATGEFTNGGLDRATLAQLAGYKRDHGVRLLLAVGGWGHSAGFAPMALDAPTRARFVDALVTFARENGFDGIDYDWEHPQNDAEQTAYAALIVDTRRAAQSHGMLVTAALAGWQQLPQEGFDALDRVHLMAYDQPGRHSTFEGAVKDVDAMLAKGVPSHKIALGVPLYGRGIEDRQRERPYWLIVMNDAPPADVDEINGLYFNNLATVARKAQFARDRKLAGVMVWELTQDMAGELSLIRAMRRVLAR